MYTKQNWKTGEAGGTLISADRLNAADDQIWASDNTNPETPAGIHRATVDSNLATLNDAIEGLGGGSSRRPAIDILRIALGNTESGPVRIVLAGSSTMAGGGPPFRYFSVGQRLTELIQASFPSGHLVETNLRSLDTDYASPSDLPGVHVLTCALGGTTSSSYLTATNRTRIAGVKPNAVFHMVGSNDWQGGITPAAYKANMLAHLADLRSKQTVPCVHVLIHQQGRKDASNAVAPWSAFRNALSEIAASFPDDVYFIDAGAQFEMFGYPDVDPFGFIRPDNVHMWENGHLALAHAIARGIGLSPTAPKQWQVIDRARRADGAIGTADTGQAWTAVVGTWTIQNQQIGGTAGTVLVDGRMFNVDVSCSMTIATGGSSGIITRAIDDTNRFYLATSETADNVTLYKTVGGTLSNLGALTIPLVAGQRVVLRLVAQAEVISGYVNGIHVATYAMSAAELTTFTNATRIGVRHSTVGDRFDNFAARARN